MVYLNVFTGKYLVTDYLFLIFAV